jgi:hypothetical protein
MDRETYLLHQVHPLKVAADLTGDVVSTALMWRHRPVAGVIAGFAPALVGSAIVTRLDLAPLRRTRRGRYVLRYMPASAQAVRFAGQVLAWRAAYRHDTAGIVVGHVVVVAGWSTGALPPRRGGRRSSTG